MKLLPISCSVQTNTRTIVQLRHTVDFGTPDISNTFDTMLATYLELSTVPPVCRLNFHFHDSFALYLCHEILHAGNDGVWPNRAKQAQLLERLVGIAHHLLDRSQWVSSNEYTLPHA